MLGEGGVSDGKTWSGLRENMLGYPGASCGKAVPPTENDCTFSCFWRVPLPRASAESLSALSDGTSTESVVPRNHGPPSRQIHRVGCLKLFEMWEGKRPYLVLPRWALFCFVFMEHITGVSSVSSCTRLPAYAYRTHSGPLHVRFTQSGHPCWRPPLPPHTATFKLPARSGPTTSHSRRGAFRSYRHGPYHHNKVYGPQTVECGPGSSIQTVHTFHSSGLFDTANQCHVLPK